MKTRNYLVAAFGMLAVLAVAACGGGGSSSAVSYPVPSPALGAGALAGASTPTQVAMASSAGLSTGLISIKGTGSVNVAQSTTLPSGLTALSERSIKGARPVPQGTTDPNVPIAYVTVTATTKSTLDGLVLTNVVPTGTIAPGTYYEAFWNGSQWVTIGTAGKLTNGNTLVFGSATITPAVTLNSGQSYTLAIYAGVLLVTPTPNPPAPIASPSAITVPLLTTGQITVTTNPSSTVTATSDTPSVATVTASTTSDTTGSATLTVTPIALGSANITITDQVGQTTKVVVTVNNTFPTPVPSPNNIVLGLNDTVQLQVSTKIGTQLVAHSSDSTILSIPSPLPTADDQGHVNVTVTAAGPGAATITFTDPTSNVGTFSATVSNIQNGAFTNGLTGWTTCSYPHTALAGPINESTPMPVASPVATQSPGATVGAVSTSLTALASVISPPANDNPSPPPGVGPTAPPILGSMVALIGSTNTSVVNTPKGEFGLCQIISVSANTPYLSFWLWEGNSGFNFKQEDQNAEILSQAGSSAIIKQTLFAEEHCYIHPPASAPSAATTSGCWPAAYGGDSSGFKDWVGGGFWSQRGPYNLSAYAGQTITLYVGQYGFFADTSASFAEFVYLGNVQMLPSSNFPTSTPLARRAGFSVQMRPKP